MEGYKMVIKKVYHDNDRYHAMIDNMMNAFAYHKIVLDESDNPIDYIFLEVNEAFEELLALKREDIIGKKVTEIIPGIQETGFNWIRTYGSVAFTGESIKFEQYQEQLQRWYTVSAYSDQPGYFATIFYDITGSKTLEQGYKTLIENVPDMIARFDRDFRYVYINPAVKCELGIEADKFLGKTNRELGMPDNFRLNWEKTLQAVFTTGQEKTIEYEFGVLGKIKYYYTRMAPEFAADRSVTTVISITRNITEHKQVEQKMKESEERWKFAIEGSGDGVWDWNIETNEVLFSTRWKEILGFTADEMSNNIKEWRSRVHPEDCDWVSEKLQEHFNGKVPIYVTEHRIKCKNGHYKWILERGKVLKWTSDGDPVRMVGTITDIDERKQTEEKMRYLSSHDQLTGLYNRAFFEQELKRLEAEGQLPWSLLMGDSNGLKLVNDAFGHHQGDKLLKQIAKIFRKIFRKEDIIARIGGDEFAVLLPNVGSKEIINIMARIRDKCFKEIADPIKPSIALGTATKEYKDQDMETIYKMAEDRMYNNKLLESKNIRSSTIASLRKTLEDKTYETEEHCQRIKTLSIRLGKKIGLSDSQLNELSLLSVLHDIGKIAIPNDILTKPGKLSPKEWKTMKQHSEIGYRIAAISPELVIIADGILSHHEYWDGGGYPQGLEKTQIPLIARMIAIIDAYDVMIHGSCYHEALPKEEAIKEIRRLSGTQFDPNIVEIFIKMVTEHIRLIDSH